MYKQYLERTSNHLVILILVMLGTCSCFTFISGTICIRPHSAKLLFGTALIICQLFSFIFYYAALLRRRGPHIASHSVCPSVRPVIITERHVAPPSELQWHTYFSARTEGRISYGHLGRTNSCFTVRCICLHTSCYLRTGIREGG